MGDLCYKLLVTQPTKFIEAIANTTRDWALEVLSLGCGRPRFSVEVAYLREDCDFVFLLFGALDC